MSPSDCLSQIRINRAKEQLLTSRSPVKEIAAQVGFADEFYFSRKFKKTVGTAPSAFLGSKKSHMAIMNFPYVGHLLALGVVPSIGVYDQNRDRHRRELLGARLHYPLKRTKRFEAQLADYNLQALRESRPELIVCSDYDSEAYGLSTMQKMGPTVVIPWIYVMAEVGLATWLPTYLVQVRGIALTEGAFYLSGFYLVFTIGRLTAHRWIGQEKAVLLCSLSAIVALALPSRGAAARSAFSSPLASASRRFFRRLPPSPASSIPRTRAKFSDFCSRPPASAPCSRTQRSGRPPASTVWASAFP